MITRIAQVWNHPLLVISAVNASYVNSSVSFKPRQRDIVWTDYTTKANRSTITKSIYFFLLCSNIPIRKWKILFQESQIRHEKWFQNSSREILLPQKVTWREADHYHPGGDHHHKRFLCFFSLLRAWLLDQPAPDFWLILPWLYRLGYKYGMDGRRNGKTSHAMKWI